MIHGPCGDFNPMSPCMDQGSCTKKFPRAFSEKTTDSEYSYPTYRRRNNGRTVTVRNVVVDNRWIVPYNPYLLMKYDCHLNVEVCNSVAAVKYLYKYVYKGHDRVMVEFKDISNNGTDEPEQHDEISNYLDARYVSASESCWRIFHFKLHGESPNIIRLQVHLPDQEMVLFNADQQLDEVVIQQLTTTLTGWMEYNATHDDARNILYHDFPKKFVWNRNEKKWTCRKSKFDVIGRMYFVRPREGERYFLRLLLCHVPEL